MQNLPSLWNHIKKKKKKYQEMGSMVKDHLVRAFTQMEYKLDKKKLRWANFVIFMNLATIFYSVSSTLRMGKMCIA